MPEVRLTERAQDDFLDIWDYIYERNHVFVADQMVDRIKETTTKYARFPQMGRPRPELKPTLRSFPVSSFVVYYRPISTGILIDRILHAAQDIDTEFSE